MDYEYWTRYELHDIHPEVDVYWEIVRFDDSDPPYDFSDRRINEEYRQLLYKEEIVILNCWVRTKKTYREIRVENIHRKPLNIEDHLRSFVKETQIIELLLKGESGTMYFKHNFFPVLKAKWFGLLRVEGHYISNIGFVGSIGKRFIVETSETLHKDNIEALFNRDSRHWFKSEVA